MKTNDIIHYNTVDNLFELFKLRAQRNSHKRVFTWFDVDLMDWVEMNYKQAYDNTSLFHQALKKERLDIGDKVGIWVRNSPEWVFCDMASFSLGLVTVPMYFDDRAENVAYTAGNSHCKIIFIEDEIQLSELSPLAKDLPELKKIITLKNLKGKGLDNENVEVIFYKDWLVGYTPQDIDAVKVRRTDLATIVYTSGTTGNPKGVMLSHKNILWNAWAGMEKIPVLTTDRFLSFLPLSHTFERTVGYYLAVMAGSEIVYCRSKYQVAGDIAKFGPSILISVPRLFEKVNNAITDQLKEKSALVRKLFDLTVNIGYDKFLYKQGKVGFSPSFLIYPLLDLIVAKKIRKKFGGNLRLSISGGAALNPKLTKIFLGLGVTVVQGYGMTELSPIVSVNTPEDNEPESVGTLLPDVKIKIADQKELLVGGPGVMLGYYGNDDATHDTIDSEGFVHTGDKAELRDGRLYIVGRIKEIIVLANGEKVPPSDIESAINLHPAIDQSFIFGENMPFLTALIVLNESYLKELSLNLGLNYKVDDFFDENSVKDEVLQLISHQMTSFPGYAKVKKVVVLKEPFSIENGLLTPTLKLKRGIVMVHYKNEIASLES